MTPPAGTTSASDWSARALRCSGLVFVVVSLHLKAVINDSVLRRRAEILLGLFATTLAVSAPLLIPGQGRQALGVELMSVALIYISLSTLATISATHSERGVSRDRLARFFLGELSAGLIVLGGLGLVIHALGGVYLAAAGTVLGVLSAMLAVWILVVGLGFELERLIAALPHGAARTCSNG